MVFTKVISIPLISLSFDALISSCTFARQLNFSSTDYVYISKHKGEIHHQIKLAGAVLSIVLGHYF